MPTNCSNSRKLAWLSSPQRAAIEQFVAGVRAQQVTLQPLLVILFGSLARAEFTTNSDADVLVVTAAPVDWLAVYRHSNGIVQPLVHSWDVVVAAITDGAPLAHEIIADGIALYDAADYYAQLRQLTQTVQRELGLERTPHGWQWQSARVGDNTIRSVQYAMTELSVERERYVKALGRDLKHLTQQLSDIPAVQKVILFGSYAAGRRDLFTDLDLLVVMRSPLDFVSRNAELAGRLRAEVALDLLVYTPQEIEKMRDRPFLRNILESGKVLYEKGSLL